MKVTSRYDLVVVGASSGGIAAVSTLLSTLPEDFTLPVVVVLHLQETTKADFTEIFRRPGRRPIREAEDKAPIEKGVLYIAPPGYHLLIEGDGTFSLSYEDKVNYSRPSIDVLFDSAAAALGDRVIGVVLTGGNADGAQGLKAIKQAGGLAIVEDPNSAEVSAMPSAAADAVEPDFTLPIAEVGPVLATLTRRTVQGEPANGEFHV